MKEKVVSSVSKRYPELHRYADRASWMFRKYSKIKGKEFRISTGVPCTDKDASLAYKKGKEAFDEWLGATTIFTKAELMGDLFQSILVSKESLKGGKRGCTYRSARNQIVNHLIPAFGHLRPSQITSERWKEYDRAERNKVKLSKYGKEIKRTKLFNTRKYLLEALLKAKNLGLIKEVPEIKNYDGDAAPPKYLNDKTVMAILDQQIPLTRLLFFIMWKQGARPNEILQYEWNMITFSKSPRAIIDIPGHITKTGRGRVIKMNSEVTQELRRLAKDADSPFLFPSRFNEGGRQTNYRKGWEAACKKLKVDAVPYNLRDTYIANTLKRGVHIATIAKYIDSSASQLEKRYVTIDDDTMDILAD